jgi:hypothetical protein
MEKKSLGGEYGKLTWCKGKVGRRAGVIRRWERELRKEDVKESYSIGEMRRRLR